MIKQKSCFRFTNLWLIYLFPFFCLIANRTTRKSIGTCLLGVSYLRFCWLESLNAIDRYLRVDETSKGEAKNSSLPFFIANSFSIFILRLLRSIKKRMIHWSKSSSTLELHSIIHRLRLQIVIHRKLLSYGHLRSVWRDTCSLRGCRNLLPLSRCDAVNFRFIVSVMGVKAEKSLVATNARDVAKVLEKRKQICKLEFLLNSLITIKTRTFID